MKMESEEGTDHKGGNSDVNDEDNDDDNNNNDPNNEEEEGDAPLEGNLGAAAVSHSYQQIKMVARLTEPDQEKSEELSNKKLQSYAKPVQWEEEHGGVIGGCWQFKEEEGENEEGKNEGDGEEEEGENGVGGENESG
ncbi:hypothetical protein TrRE_jg10399, partial [Triparma retinervis]